jgi:hypothetical protein
MINEKVKKRLNRNLAIMTISVMLLAATGATYIMVTTEHAFAVDPITNCFNLVGEALDINDAGAYAQHYQKFRNILPSEMGKYGFPSIQTIPELATFMSNNEEKLNEILTAISSDLQVAGFSDSQQDQILSCIHDAYN